MCDHPYLVGLEGGKTGCGVCGTVFEPGDPRLELPIGETPLVSFRLPAEQLETLDELAAADDRFDDRSDAIRFALRQYLQLAHE